MKERNKMKEKIIETVKRLDTELIYRYHMHNVYLPTVEALALLESHNPEYIHYTSNYRLNTDRMPWSLTVPGNGLLLLGQTLSGSYITRVI